MDATAPPSASANFNSRPCARGDCQLFYTLKYGVISIPAPARGATSFPVFVSPNVLLFQFPPLREGRRGARVALHY